MKKKNTHHLLFILALIAGILTSNLGLAHETEDDPNSDPHKGIFMGINAGGGESGFSYKEGSRHITEKGTEGGMGGLRLGYSFSSSFALSLEGFGFGHGGCDNDEEKEWGFGAGVLAATWHPGGSGFFLRGGAGMGGGEFLHPDSGDRIELRERAAFLFSIGYDWNLNDSLTLGFSIDSLALDAGGTTGHDDDYLGASGLNVQFNWYL